MAFDETLAALLNSTFNFRSLFYLVTPSETSPLYLNQFTQPIYNAVIPYVIALIAIEIAVSIIRGEHCYQINDAVTTLSARFFSMIPGMFTATLQLSLYLHIHNHYAIYSPSVHSIWTWLVAVIGIDFCFYWFHRCAHEINILWAFHQTHHSSEYFHLITALRFPAIADFLVFTFFLPLALFVPMPIFICHSRLNAFYQVWIHASFVGDLGPIEWIFNTPKHHRIHHGRNPYCLDKNYAGFLIIWDRLFGTFALEKEGEQIQFGLVENIKTFDFLYLQLGAMYDVFKKLVNVLRSKKYSGEQKVKNAFKACFYGPGWTSRKPEFRLGDPAAYPKVKPDSVAYNPAIPRWQTLYCLAHFIMVVLALFALPPYTLYNNFHKTVFAYVATGCSIGFIFDRRAFAPLFEFSRCLAFAVALGYLTADFPEYGKHSLLISLFRGVYCTSLCPWAIFMLLPAFLYVHTSSTLRSSK